MHPWRTIIEEGRFDMLPIPERDRTAVCMYILGRSDEYGDNSHGDDCLIPPLMMDRWLETIERYLAIGSLMEAESSDGQS